MTINTDFTESSPQSSLIACQSPDCLKSKISSEIQGNLFTVTPCQIKSKNYTLPRHNGTEHTLPFQKGRKGWWENTWSIPVASEMQLKVIQNDISTDPAVTQILAPSLLGWPCTGQGHRQSKRRWIESSHLNTSRSCRHLCNQTSGRSPLQTLRTPHTLPFVLTQGPLG